MILTTIFVNRKGDASLLPCLRVYPYTALDDPRIKDLITGGKFDDIDAPLRPVA